MPRGDGTGPLGQGPKTGRGGQGRGGQGRGGQGRGGQGRGGQGRGGQGRGGRRGAQRAAAEVPEDTSAAASPDSLPQSELQMLQTQVEAASAALEQIRQRLEELAAEQAPAASPGRESSSTDA